MKYKGSEMKVASGTYFPNYASYISSSVRSIYDSKELWYPYLTMTHVPRYAGAYMHIYLTVTYVSYRYGFLCCSVVLVLDLL